MFSFKSKRVRPFSIATSKDFKRQDLPLEERMKFQSLQYSSPSRSPKKAVIYLVLLIAVIAGIAYLNVSSNFDNIKFKVEKKDLEKVVR